MSEHDAGQPPSEVVKAIIINHIGSQKISAIKLLRQMTDLGLKEAKDITEQPTPFVLTICNEAQAIQFQELAQDAGMACELREPRDTDQPAIPATGRFNLELAGKSGCATTTCLLLLAGGGLIYALQRLL